MPRVSLPFDPAVGPVITVDVYDPASYRPDHEMPRQETLSFLVDSGASDSSIRGGIAQRLALPVLGLHDVTGFGHAGRAYQYLADLDLILDQPYPMPNWKLIHFDTPYTRIDGILGRDILAKGRFVLDGPNQTFTLEF